MVQLSESRRELVNALPLHPEFPRKVWVVVEQPRGGMGTPPKVHFDVFLLTAKELCPGEIVEGYICGVFLRRDGDHKFVAMDEVFWREVGKADIDALDEERYANVRGLYPRIGENEGWFGGAIARGYLANALPTHD